MNTKKKEKNQNIKVFVRVRPMNNLEKQQRASSVVDISGSKELRISERTFDKLSKTFTFDGVFGPVSKQIDVYNSVVGPAIDEVLSGYNCTVFAYGQTGTGKTFTMLGEKGNAMSSWQTDPLAGVIPRAVGHLIDELRILDVEYTIRVSFLELYNEELFDLLSPVDDNSKIRLFEDSTKKGSVIIHGLEEVTVHSKNEVFNIMDRGTMKRQTAATLMNANSSRSHTVFSITVHMREKKVDEEELLKTGKLNLVDLAGSENIGRSGAIDKRAREAGNINQSLLTLGRVITALVEHTPHVPYRESKLTRLLQDSLGGRTKTSIIATVSPASSNLEETLSTLEYAHRAKNIQNRPEVNEKLSKAQLIKEYTEEIDRLRRDLLAARERNGVYIALENYNEMTRQLELNRQEINEKLQLIKVLEKEKSDKEALCQELKISLEETKDDLVESKNTLKLAAETVEEQLERERELAETARDILAVANVSTVDIMKLHDKLDRKRSVEEVNSRISQDFRKDYSKKVAHLQENIANFLSGISRNFNEMKKRLDNSQQKRNSDLSVLSEDMMYLVKTLTTMLQKWSKQSSEETVATQQNIQKLLQDARSITDTETNVVHNFLTEIFLPLMQNIQHQIQRLKVENDGFSRLVNEQATRNNEMVLTYTRTLMESVAQVKQSHLVNLQKIDQISEKIHKNQKKKSEAFEKYTEELESNLRSLSQIAKNAELRHQEYVIECKNDESEIEDDLKLIQENTEKCAVLANAAFESEERQIRDLRASAEVQCEETADIVKGFNDRVSSVTNSIEECYDETETVVRKSVSATEEAWVKQYSFFEHQIRHISQNIRDLEKHHQEHTQLLTEGLHKSAHSHEAHLEEQRMSYSTFVDDYTLSLEQQGAQTSDWVHNVDNYIQERDNDVEELLTQLLQQDVPTGQTPQRREYNYPKVLVSTTPSRIMGKLQKINEVAQFRELVDEVSTESSEDNSSSREAQLPDTQSDHENRSSLSTLSIEDISGAATAHSPGFSMVTTRGPQIRNNLRVSRSTETINKENSAPTEDQDQTKFMKSVSLNDMKVTPRRALNAKN